MASAVKWIECEDHAYNLNRALNLMSIFLEFCDEENNERLDRYSATLIEAHMLVQKAQAFLDYAKTTLLNEVKADQAAKSSAG